MDLMCARDDAKEALTGQCTTEAKQGHEYVLTHLEDCVLDLPLSGTMTEEHNAKIVERTELYLLYCHKMHIEVEDSAKVLHPIWYDGFVTLVLAPLVLPVRGVTTLTMKTTITNGVSSITAHFVSTNDWEGSVKLQQAYDLSHNHQVVVSKDETTYKSTHYEVVNAGAIQDIKMPPFLWRMKDDLTHKIASNVCCTVMKQVGVQAEMVLHTNKYSSGRLAARPSTPIAHLATNLDIEQLPRLDPEHKTAPSQLDTEPKDSRSSQRKKVSATWSTLHESQRNIDDAGVVKQRKSTRARVQVVQYNLAEPEPFGGFIDNFGAFPT